MFDDRTHFLFEFIIENIEIVTERFASISTPSDFVVDKNSKVLLDSIVLRLQVIGENIKKLDKINPELFIAYPEIKWNEIINFRDLISHHYEMLDYEIIFDICKNDLAPLKENILRIKQN